MLFWSFLIFIAFICPSIFQYINQIQTSKNQLISLKFNKLSYLSHVTKNKRKDPF